MRGILIKDGVQLDKLNDGGSRILNSLIKYSNSHDVTITITSGNDGVHSGPNDPHHLGQALDVRSKDWDMSTKKIFLDEIMDDLGWTKFYGFLESQGTDNEHFHFQVIKGGNYP